MFAGTHTALVTPFRNDKIDEAGYERLIEAQIAAGLEGIVPVGTTGESPTLDHAEHNRVVELAVKAAKGRCHVIAGTGSNATAEAIALTQEAERIGATGSLQVAPYYNKPSQEGLFQHFRAIANATKLPIILYSIPARCGVEIGIDTVARLAAECANIVAIKEAGGTVERVSALRAVLPKEFEILSGDDSMTLPFISAGAVGVISVASNLIPGEVRALVQAALAGDFVKAQAQHTRLYPLFRDLFIEPNPVPIKLALSLRDGLTPDVRLPLCPMSDTTRAKLEKTLRSLNLHA